MADFVTTSEFVGADLFKLDIFFELFQKLIIHGHNALSLTYCFFPLHELLFIKAAMDILSDEVGPY